MSEQHDQDNKQQLPGRGIKWQRIADVPCAESESQSRHSARDALFGKRVTKRQDGVTHGKIVFCPMASPSSQSSEQSIVLSSPATHEDISITSVLNSSEAKFTCISSTPKATASDSEDCVVVDSSKVPSNTHNKSGANKLIISTTIPMHIASASVSLKTLVQVILEYNGHKRGLDTMWKHMGVETNMGHCLYPEEALFLMQASDFRALCPKNRVLSVVHALVLTNTPYAAFRVYSKLCGAALKPVRHQPHVGITSYEKKIKLDQHNKFKKKKTTVPGQDQISAIQVSASPSNSIATSEPPCSSNAVNTAEISNVVSTAKFIDRKDDIDMEMVAFYSCIQEEAKEEKDTPIDNTTEPKDEMEDAVEENEDFVITDDMLKDYERSKQLILEDLPSMNPRTGECRIKAATNFLPTHLKVLTEDYVVLGEDIYKYSKKAMRASGIWKQNMNNLSNCAGRSDLEPTIGVEPIDCNSDSSEILDSDTETSSSSDSESVSSLSDSEDVCYQGWYTDWNNIIYMKRIMSVSDNVTYDAGKRDLDEPDDRSDKCVKYARCGSSPPYVDLIHDQNLVQHQGRGATPSAQMTSSKQGSTIGLSVAPINDGDSNTDTATDPNSPSTHKQSVVPNLEVARAEYVNLVREDLALSETDSSSGSSSSSSSTRSSSRSSSSDSEDSSSVAEDTVKIEKDRSPDRDEPVCALGEKDYLVGNTIDQIVDDPNKMVDSNAENGNPQKVSWENPVGDFLNILGQSLKINSYNNRPEESPETMPLSKEEPALQEVVNGDHECVQEDDSSTVSSVINLIYAVRKGTEISDGFSNSAKFMKQEVDEDICILDQHKHGRFISSNTPRVLGAGAVRVSSHTSTSYRNSMISMDDRPVHDNASGIGADNNDDLRMSLPERGPSRGSSAIHPRSGRGSLHVTVSNVRLPSDNGRNLVGAKGAGMRCVHSAPNGELRVSLGCASTSSDSSFNTRKKDNQSRVVGSNELTSDLSLLERLGEQYPSSIQQKGEAGNTWKPPSDFGSPSHIYNCKITVPNTSTCGKPNNLAREPTYVGVESNDFISEVFENTESSEAMAIDANYHEIPSSKRSNFRGRISHTGSPGQSNKRGFCSPQGKQTGKPRANYKFCDVSLEKGEYQGSVKTTEARNDSLNPNFKTLTGSYSGGCETPPLVAHCKKRNDRDIRSVQGKNSYLFSPPCSANTFPKYQKCDDSRPFTNQNTNYWRGNNNEGSCRPNQSQDSKDVTRDNNFGGNQPEANTQGDHINSWQRSNEGHSFNQYSFRGRGQASEMHQDSWRATPDCGRGSTPRSGGDDGSWIHIGRGFKNVNSKNKGSSHYSAETLEWNRGEGDNFTRGRGDNFSRGRNDNFHRGSGGGNFHRGRGGDNFHRGRGGDNFHRGRGGDNFHRGRGEDKFHRGRGGDNFHRGKGGDNFPRGRGGDSFLRGTGGDSFPRRRGGDNFSRGSGGEIIAKGRGGEHFPGEREDHFPKGERNNFPRGAGGAPSNERREHPSNTNSSNNRGQNRGRGNARQQTRQGRWNYWQTFKAQKSMLDESIVHNVSSWHEYKSAVRSKELERQRRRPSVAALFAGDAKVKPIITHSEGHAPTLGAVLAKVRGECSTSNTSSSSGGGDLGEWLQHEVAGAAALYTPSHLPQVAFDVYSCKSNYSRSNPSIPEFRVVLPGEESDENFSACRVLALRRHHADSADLALATNAESTGRVRHVAFPASPSSDGRLRPHALTWSKKLYERR